MIYPAEIQSRIRAGRKSFVSMCVAYVFGVFNDNYFKEAAILLAFTAGLKDLQAPIIKYFSLPFILFSAYAGFFADRFPKRNVIIVAKLFEVVAMGIGAVGIALGNFPLIVGMVFCMALQSTLFGPALNGAIPELYPEVYVPKANAVLKMVTTVAVIIGVVSAGITLDLSWTDSQRAALDHLSGGETATLASRIVQRFNIDELERGPLTVGLVCFGVALVGFLSAFGAKRTPTPDHRFPFPWRGPFDSIAAAVAKRKDPLLIIAFSASSFFYFASTLVLAILHELCIEALGFSPSETSISMGATAIGIAVGALLAAKLSERFSWRETVPKAIVAFGVFTALVAVVDGFPETMEKAVLFVMLLAAGAAGGMVLIPAVTFIQVRPGADEKGRTIGIANFLDFTGIFIAGELFRQMNAAFSPKVQLMVTGVGALAVAWAFAAAFKRAPEKNA